MVTIQLGASDASLRLSANGGTWCEVSLVKGSELIFLGGDSLAKVRDGFLRFVGKEFGQTPAGEIEGVPVTWVMSLMEGHTSLYAADTAGGRALFIQSADGVTIAKLVLDGGQSRVWQESLAELATV